VADHEYDQVDSHEEQEQADTISWRQRARLHVSGNLGAWCGFDSLQLHGFTIPCYAK
jgi:hypothetical protein